MSRRTHIADPSDGRDVSSLGASLCGRTTVVRNPNPELATCRVCQRLHREARFTRRDGKVSMEEALADVARLIAGPPVESYPPLTPERWQAMRCLDGKRRCFCAYCELDRRNHAARVEWELEQDRRPHRRYDHPFGSVRAALESLVVWRQTGASVRSQAGSIEARGQELAKLGTNVQTTMRVREDVDTRRATIAVDVERACLRAYAEPQARRGLNTAEQCVAILLDAMDDKGGHSAEWWSERTGLTVNAIRALIRHGIKQAKVELAASGYIPHPRSKEGLDEAIRRRRQEVTHAES